MRRYKIKNLVILFITVTALAGCRKMTEFKIHDSAEFVVPSTAVAFVPVLSTMEVTTSSSYEFKNNGTDAKHVKEVKLDKVSLTITQPSGEDFSFLNSIHIYISASGLPEVELAYLDDIPSTAGNMLDLITTGATLDAYLKKDGYQLRVQTVTDETFTENITIRSDMTFNVRAKLL